MKRVKNAVTKLQNNVMMRMAGVNPQMESGDHLIEVLGVIIICVILLMFFKNKILNVFGSMINGTSDSVNNLWNNKGLGGI